jgi:hypothetical protein
MNQQNELTAHPNELSGLLTQVNIFEVLSEQFEKAFATEFSKLTEKEQPKIALFCLNLSVQRKLHVFFTENNLAIMGKLVLEDEDIRDFVFNLTDKLSHRIGYKNSFGFDLVKYLADCISSFQEEKDLDNSFCLIPKVYLQNMSLYSDEIEKTLSNNKWLTTLVLINIFFFESQIDSKAIQSAKTNPGRFKQSAEQPT